MSDIEFERRMNDQFAKNLFFFIININILKLPLLSR